MRVSWPPILAHAALIVESYQAGPTRTLVTLRQLYYRLVADGTLPNLHTYYTRLSGYTAEARRNGTFPDLLDRTARIERRLSFTGPNAALDFVRNLYRKDRTEGQPWQIWLGVEKAGLSEQLTAWFGTPFGLPHVALGGYGSQSLVTKVQDAIHEDGRQSVFIYAGDLDPTGEDIDRDFVERVDAFDEVHRVALDRTQVAAYGLPNNTNPEVLKKLERDPRAQKFFAKHGTLDQYEVDALPPDVLRNLFQNAIDLHWDDDALDEVMEQEEQERSQLADLRVQPTEEEDAP